MSLTVTDSPPIAGVVNDQTRRVLESLAAYVVEYGGCDRPPSQALMVAMLASRYGMDPETAVDEAIYGTTGTTREAGQHIDVLLAEARKRSAECEAEPEPPYYLATAVEAGDWVVVHGDVMQVEDTATDDRGDVVLTMTSGRVVTLGPRDEIKVLRDEPSWTPGVGGGQ